MSVVQRRLRRSFAAGVALAALWAGLAAAQSRPVHVQLPALPMDRALEQLAKQSGNMVGLSNPIYFNFDPNF
jgi:hypothetical protein